MFKNKCKESYSITGKKSIPYNITSGHLMLQKHPMETA
jgi:hypothetical protein